LGSATQCELQLSHDSWLLLATLLVHRLIYICVPKFGRYSVSKSIPKAPSIGVR